MTEELRDKLNRIAGSTLHIGNRDDFTHLHSGLAFPDLTPEEFAQLCNDDWQDIETVFKMHGYPGLLALEDLLVRRTEDAKRKITQGEFETEEVVQRAKNLYHLLLLKRDLLMTFSARLSAYGGEQSWHEVAEEDETKQAMTVGQRMRDGLKAIEVLILDEELQFVEHQDLFKEVVKRVDGWGESVSYKPWDTARRRVSGEFKRRGWDWPKDYDEWKSWAEKRRKGI